MLPVQSGKPAALPSSSYKVRVKNEFEEIIKNSLPQNVIETCWRVVLNQCDGRYLLIASKAFYRKFHRSDSVVTLGFPDGDVILTKTYFEALKIDSEVFGAYFDEGAVNTLSFDFVTKAAFLALIAFLYEDSIPKKAPDNLIEFARAAHYLNIKSASKFAIDLFKREISAFGTIEDLKRALALKDRIVTLPFDLRDQIDELLAPYFGKILYVEPDKEKIVKQYNKFDVSALYFEGYDEMEATIKAFANLATLKSLTLSNISCLAEHFSYFPRSIVRLKLPFTNIENNLAGFCRLPRSLLYLDLSCWDITAAEIKLLPRELKSLILAKCKNLTNAVLANIPRTVSDLDISYTGIEKLAGLPPFLERLNISACNIEDDELVHVNEDLKQLDISICRKGPFKRIFRFTKLTHLIMKESEFEGGLSAFRQIELIDIRNTNVTNQDLAGLSPTLRTLKLGKCRNINAVGVRQIPATVENLDISYIVFAYEFIPYLSRNLKKLKFYNSQIPPSKIFRYLPRYLSSLKIHYLHNRDVAYLPRHLEYLSIGFTDDIDVGYANLPQGLRVLKILCNFFNDSHIELLPSSINALVLVGAEVTDTGLSKLNKEIRSLKILTCPNLTNEGLSHLGHLAVLNLVMNPGINDKGINKLSPHLMRAHLRGSFTKDCVKARLPGTVIYYA